MWVARYQVQRKCYGHVAPIVLRSVDLFVWSIRLLKCGLGATRLSDRQRVLAILGTIVRP